MTDPLQISPIAETVRPLNERMWLLVGKERDGTITAPEQREVNLIFANLETEQENAR